jgi:hypothetical protein
LFSSLVFFLNTTELLADEKLYNYGMLFGGLPAINYSAELAHVGGGAGTDHPIGGGHALGIRAAFIFR